LQKAISMSVRDLGLQQWASQVEKVKQLHSQLLVRHGVMLVGPTGGGKSTTRAILQRALVLLPAIVAGEEAHDPHKDPRRQSMFMVRPLNESTPGVRMSVGGGSRGSSVGSLGNIKVAID
jgi:energy-coupling factor transporter ATP-binding protein EcfA2